MLDRIFALAALFALCVVTVLTFLTAFLFADIYPLGAFVCLMCGVGLCVCVGYETRVMDRQFRKFSHKE
jgi:hypothetical protein